MRKLAMIVAASVLLGSPALAQQHDHGNVKGPNGGPVKDVAGVHAEFVASGTTVTFHILNEDNKPVAAKGYTGSALIVSGSERETVQLTAGDNWLKGEAKKALPSGAAVTLQVKTDAGKSGQARFNK
ncbi:hypothetical protein CQ12_15035 [Bradyrhizobium jicamae]|uniref:Uncharacterized protein n=1 Tax=Bradyrhizobium jicamae TaxID=280332 RepID=A0A0R3L2D6_9BRAD|nr:hypothetical protein [Bradyrhizobium jicamae]KRR01985.1 hypothetical protein CQ12_15035 [Bradyrhizobium jicamae]